MDPLNSPLVYLKLKTLILDTLNGILSHHDFFLDVVSKMGVEVLILQKESYSEARDSLISSLITNHVRVWLE